MENSEEIAHIGFRPPNETGLVVEALSIEELRRRAPSDHFDRLQRADFFRLIGVTSGTTRPMVDFSYHAAKAADWFLVRPGQVFRYDFTQPWSGWLLVFRPDALADARHGDPAMAHDPLRRVEDLPDRFSLDPEPHGWMVRSLRQMQHDGVLTADLTLRNALLRLQLTQTLLRLSMWQSVDKAMQATAPGGRRQFRRFQHLLEQDFCGQHRVRHYANALGMSDKTLSRVCVAATGLPAKALISQRLVLEAKRLLAHTSNPVQLIGHDLGFDEASNFVKFFRKETQTTPLGFRRHMADPVR